MNIKKEFKNRLWKLTDEEYENLEKDILKNGCREKLTTWNDYIIDGHNRYEICKKHNIKFETIEKEFETEEDVFYWIDANQLSRRNLLDWQRSIIEGRISKLYKQKLITNPKGHFVATDINQKTIAERLGKSTKTLQRSEKFTDTYDNFVKDIGKDEADELASTLTKNDFTSLTKETPTKQLEIVEQLKNGVKNVKEAKKKIEINNRKETASKIKIDNTFELNKLFKGDAVEILKTFPDNIVDCVLMDPPWGVEYKEDGRRETYNPEFEDSSIYAFKVLDDVCKELKRICKSNAHVYCVFGMDNYQKFYDILNNYFTVEKQPLIWIKNNHTLRDFSQGYAFQYEPIFFATDRTRLLNNKISRNILNYDIPTNKLHKAQKPIKLLEYLINNSTVEGEIVLDPFMGSGSTCKAAKNINRKYLGIELNEEAFNISVDYIKKNKFK